MSFPSIDVIPRPTLSRSYATVVDSDEKQSSENALIVENVLSAYDTVGIKGQPLAIPGGQVVCDDPWLHELEETLEEHTYAGTLEDFSLEVWLSDKVETQGTHLQRETLGKLRRDMDEYENVHDDQVILSGLPDNITAVCNQPLAEIEVYRGIAKLDVDSREERGRDVDDDDRQKSSSADEPGDIDDATSS